MGRSYATLDLYLWQRWSLHQGEKQLDKPERYLWFAEASYKRYQQLRERGERVRQIWPESPYYWCYDRCTLAFRQRRRGRAIRRESAQSARAAGAPQRLGRTGEIKQAIAERTAALASGYRAEGIAPVIPWKQRERERARARAHRSRPVDERLKALVERTERIAAVLGRDSLELGFDIPTRSWTNTPASQPPQDAAVPPWKLRQSRARNRNGARAPTKARSTASQPPETVASAPPDQNALDLYATLARTHELSKAAQELVARQKAATADRVLAARTPPVPPVPSQAAPPPRPEPPPAEQSPRLAAGAKTVGDGIEKMLGAIQTLFQAALNFQPG
jgi:hypothetical protein